MLFLNQEKRRGDLAMAKRLLSLILCLTIFVLLVPAAAMAWDGIIAETLEAGDTV